MSKINTELQVLNNIPGVEDLTNENAADCSGGFPGLSLPKQKNKSYFKSTSQRTSTYYRNINGKVTGGKRIITRTNNNGKINKTVKYFPFFS